MKKVFNSIKNLIKPPQEEQMVEEAEEDNRAPALDITVAKMIDKFLHSSDFLKVKNQKG